MYCEAVARYTRLNIAILHTTPHTDSHVCSQLHYTEDYSGIHRTTYSYSANYYSQIHTAATLHITILRDTQNYLQPHCTQHYSQIHTAATLHIRLLRDTQNLQPHCIQHYSQIHKAATLHIRLLGDTQNCLQLLCLQHYSRIHTAATLHITILRDTQNYLQPHCIQHYSQIHMAATLHKRLLRDTCSYSAYNSTHGYTRLQIDTLHIVLLTNSQGYVYLHCIQPCSLTHKASYSYSKHNTNRENNEQLPCVQGYTHLLFQQTLVY